MLYQEASIGSLLRGKSSFIADTYAYMSSGKEEEEVMVVMVEVVVVVEVINLLFGKW